MAKVWKTFKFTGVFAEKRQSCDLFHVRKAENSST